MSPAERERRSIQAANTAQRKASDNGAARRASGQAMQASRQQIGQDMIDRRAGKQQADDINAIVNVPRPRKTLRTVEPRGPLLGQTGTGNYQAPPANTGGGIASPLTEVVNSREYHPTSQRVSTDGAVVFEVRAAKTVTMTDANGATVLMEYQNVPA